LLKTNL